MTSDCANKCALIKLFFQELVVEVLSFKTLRKLPYILGCFITIHFRHVAVHKYKPVQKLVVLPEFLNF